MENFLIDSSNGKRRLKGQRVVPGSNPELPINQCDQMLK